MKNICRLLIIFVLIINSYKAIAAPPPIFKPDRFSLSLKGEYFRTTDNFDDVGDEVELGSDNSYDNLTTSFDGTYFFLPELSVGGGLTYARANSERFGESYSNSQLTDVHGLVQYKIFMGDFQLIPEVSGLFALNNIEKYDGFTGEGDEAITAEGVNVIRAGSWAVMNLLQSKLKGYGFLGYAYRDDGRSSLLPWTVGVAKRFFSGKLVLSGEFGGYESITDDEYTDQPGQRTVTTSRVNGSSFRYYSVNPRLVETKIEASYTFVPAFQASIGVGTGLAGENTASGDSIYFGLTYNYDGLTTTEPQATKSNKNKKPFKFDMEKDYDDSLYEEPAEDTEESVEE